MPFKSLQGFTKSSKRNRVTKMNDKNIVDTILETFRTFSFPIGITLGAIITLLVSIMKKQIENLITKLLSKIPLFVSLKLRFNLWEKQYRKVISNEHKHIRLPGFRKQFEIAPPKLKEIYIELELQTPSKHSHGIDLSPAMTLRDTYNMSAVLNKFQHIVILGDPGAGKTTLLEYLVVLSADKKKHSSLSRLLPLFIPLRNCLLNGRSLIDEVTDPTTGILPADLLAKYPKDYFEFNLENSQCLILFDGMDEVLDEARTVAASRLIETCASLYPKSKIIVTSRIAGWRNLLGSGFSRFVIRRLSTRGIERLVTRWFQAVVLDRARNQALIIPEELAKRCRSQALELSDKVLKVVSSSDGLKEIATTPLILSLICLVYYFRHDLPEKRALLYEECCRILMEDWDKFDKQLSPSPALNYEQKHTLLQSISISLFKFSAIELSRDDLLSLLRDSLSKLGIEGDTKSVLQDIQERSGLIIEKAIGRFGFSHLTFQEYFTAVGLLKSPDGLSLLLDKIEQDEDYEIALLFAGAAPKCDELIVALIEKFESCEENRIIVLAGKAAVEGQNISLKLKSRLITRLTETFNSALDEEDLLEIQSVLRQLGVERHIIRTFENYDIFDEIGRGGFATTFRAVERDQKRDVLLKVYNSGSVRIVEQVAKELEILRDVTHPSLVKLWNVGSYKDQLFVAMEFVDGAPLYFFHRYLLNQYFDRFEKDRIPWAMPIQVDLERMLHSSSLPEVGTLDYFQWVIAMGIDIANGVNALHEARLVHGDLKPSNVIVFWDGNRIGAKVSDFCIDAVVANNRQLHKDSYPHNLSITKTWSMDRATLDPTTINHLVPFSKKYSAPELMKGKSQRLNASIDVYSLAVMLSELFFLPTHERNHRHLPNKLILTESSSAFGQIKNSDISKILKRNSSENPQFRSTSVMELMESLKRAMPFDIKI
jgi:serine/threonine protein kinase